VGHCNYSCQEGKNYDGTWSGKKQPERQGCRMRKKAGMAMVSVEQCNSYYPDKTHYALQKSLQYIRFNPPRGRKVLLKPNIIGQNTPEQATTTHPGIIDAVCRYFSKHGCSISIGVSWAFCQGAITLRESAANMLMRGMRHILKL